MSQVHGDGSQNPPLHRSNTNNNPQFPVQQISSESEDSWENKLNLYLNYLFLIVTSPYSLVCLIINKLLPEEMLIKNSIIEVLTRTINDKKKFNFYLNKFFKNSNKDELQSIYKFLTNGNNLSIKNDLCRLYFLQDQFIKNNEVENLNKIDELEKKILSNINSYSEDEQKIIKRLVSHSKIFVKAKPILFFMDAFAKNDFDYTSQFSLFLKEKSTVKIVQIGNFLIEGKNKKFLEKCFSLYFERNNSSLNNFEDLEDFEKDQKLSKKEEAGIKQDLLEFEKVFLIEEINKQFLQIFLDENVSSFLSINLKNTDLEGVLFVFTNLSFFKDFFSQNIEIKGQLIQLCTLLKTSSSDQKKMQEIAQNIQVALEKLPMNEEDKTKILSLISFILSDTSGVV